MRYFITLLAFRLLCENWIEIKLEVDKNWIEIRSGMGSEVTSRSKVALRMPGGRAWGIINAMT